MSPPWIVFDTCEPKREAPRNSKTAATKIAFFIDKDPERAGQVCEALRHEGHEVIRQRPDASGLTAAVARDQPDMVIIEKKAAGAPLIQEFRAIGVPVSEYSPSRGADKRVRINSVADIFASGMVWAPDTRWAREVIDQVAEFPNSEHDEHVDCISQALMRFRQGGFIRLPSDEPDEIKYFKSRRRGGYY